jgi:hypothetical protein
VICLSHPFDPTQPSSARAARLAEGNSAIAIDILLVVRALPIATAQALAAPNVKPRQSLMLSDDGVPEIDAADLFKTPRIGKPGDPKYDVGPAEKNDFLFRLDAHTLSGPKGDGNSAVPAGALCLFRPFTGQVSPQSIYLLSRSDSRAFGATGAEWTVGLLQNSPGGGMRVRYRAASDRLECASELVQPADTIQVLAEFIRVAL